MLSDINKTFELGEFFAYICPGATLFVSLLIWFPADPNAILFQNSLLLAFVMVVGSYSLGLIMASYVVIGEHRYDSLWRPKLGVIRRIGRVFLWYASRHRSQAVVEWEIQVAEVMDRLRAPASYKDRNITDRLTIVRAVLCSASEKTAGIAVQADRFRRRFLFAKGVGLASLIIATSTVLRIIVSFLESKEWVKVDDCLQSIGLGWLILIVVLALVIAALLRRAGHRMAAMETYLTACLADHPRLLSANQPRKEGQPPT